MNKSESSPEEDSTSDKPIESDEVTEDVSEELTIPLSQYEKIKDDYLRLAADFENYKKRSTIYYSFFFMFFIICNYQF